MRRASTRSSRGTVVDVVVVPQEPNGRPFQLHLGQLAHAAVAECLRRPHGRLEPIVDLAAITRILEADPLRHDRRRGELLLRSFVRCYVETHLLPSPWCLEAVERRRFDGRIDLLFRNVVTAQVLADELKTARGRRGHLEVEDLDQVARYLRDLRAEFGADLIGVRLILLGPPTESRLFRSVSDLARALRETRPESH